MLVHIHILDADPALRPWKKMLERVAGSTVEKVSALLDLRNVDLIFWSNPQETVKEVGGIGGYTPDQHRVIISLDPKVPNFKQAIKTTLPATIAHELHHSVRWRKPGYGNTLLEALVTEGLADHFVKEVIDIKPPLPWTRALSGAALKKMLMRAKRSFHEPYDHQAWFFGSKELNIPRWSGYSLGFHIIGEYLKKNPGVHASKLVAQNAKLFI